MSNNIPKSKSVLDRAKQKNPKIEEIIKQCLAHERKVQYHATRDNINVNLTNVIKSNSQ